jgi:hypothetical protein
MREDEIDEITGVSSGYSAHSNLTRSGTDRSSARKNIPPALDLNSSIIPSTALREVCNMPLDASTKGKKSWFAQIFLKFSLPLLKRIRKVAARIHGKKYVEVLRVVHLCQGNPRLFQDGWIDTPRKEDKLYGSVISIGGWVMGKESQPIAVRVTSGQLLLAEVPFNIPRLDVVKVYFSNHIALGNIINFGYGIELAIAELLEESELQLEAVFPEGYIAPIGLVCLSKFGHNSFQLKL